LLDGDEEVEGAAEERDGKEAVKSPRAGGEEIAAADTPHAVSESGPKESEHANADENGKGEASSGHGSAEAQNEIDNTEKEGSEEGSEKSRELPPDSDDESGKSVCAESG